MLQLAFFKAVGAAAKALDKFTFPYSDGSDYAKRMDLARNLLVNILFSNSYEFNNGNDMKVVKSTSKRPLQTTILYALFSVSNNGIETFEGVFISREAAANSMAHRIDDDRLISLAFTGDCKGYKIRPTEII